MTVLLVSCLKIEDQRRAAQLHQTVRTVCPDTAVQVAWDNSPAHHLGQDIWQQVSILGFRDMEAAQAFLDSPGYRMVATMRAASGEASVQIVHSALDFDQLSRQSVNG